MLVSIAALLMLLQGQSPDSAMKPPKGKWAPSIQVRSGLTASKTWNSELAAHLLRRAGFGGTPGQIALLASMTREQAVEYLINYDRIPDDPVPIKIESHRFDRLPPGERETPEFQARLMARQKADREQMQQVTAWWIQTMIQTPRPLQEKLVLFWHGHFTSGFREVKSSRAMYDQNQLYRKNAAGNFRDLLIAVTHDPAMILYLNSNQNHKGKPNENYARELLELFTLGARHYTEKDIKEAARALTGIGLDIERDAAQFHPRLHDDGVKTFLGRTGNLGADEVIDVILQQPACAEFIVRKLWTFFAYEDPEDRVVKALAQAFRDAHYQLKPLLKALFICDAFYSEKARFTHIKCPAELLVGTLRLLDTPAADAEGLNFALRAMGQQLFQPPNVKGWDGGQTWITPSTLLTRYNAMCMIVEGNDTDQTRSRRAMMREMARESFGKEADMMKSATPDALQPQYDPLPLMRAEHLVTADQIIDYFSGRLLQRPLPPERRSALLESFSEDLKRAGNDAAQVARAVRGLLKLIVSTPEYQLS